jgi:hypothetical protein
MDLCHRAVAAICLQKMFSANSQPSSMVGSPSHLAFATTVLVYAATIIENTWMGCNAMAVRIPYGLGASHAGQCA